MSTIIVLKKIKNFLPRYSLLVLYHAYVLPILDYGDIIYDNYTTIDSISSKAFRLLQVSLSSVVSGAHPTILFSNN